MVVKNKRAASRKHMNQTGGGPPPEMQLNEIEEKVVFICGATAIDGDENVDEMGFGASIRKNTTTETPLKVRNNVIDDNSSQSSTQSQESEVKKRAQQTPTKTRSFNTQQNSVDKALELQVETNNLLKRIIQQNDNILERLDVIVSRFSCQNIN